MENVSNQEMATEDEIRSAVEVLSKLNRGFLPRKIFDEVTRLTTTPIVEIVPFRRNNGSCEILLLRREADDPVWPNQLHTPGTVVRATDTLQSCFDRILGKEMGGVETPDPTFVTNVLHDSGRGNEAAQLYWVEVSGEVPGGEFYDVTELPDELVTSQMDFIPLAIESYKAQQSHNT